MLDFGLAIDQHPRVADPGMATTVAPGLLTAEGTIVGTIAYMSPEQARGQALTPQSDLFAFGVVLYELTVGRHPFVRDSAPETLTAIIREDPPPLPAGVPPPLRWIIERLLSKDPADRYDSTRDLYRDLRQLRDRASEATNAADIGTSTNPRRAVRGGGTRARELLLIAAGAAITALAAAAGDVESDSTATDAATRRHVCDRPARRLEHGAARHAGAVARWPSPRLHSRRSREQSCVVGPPARRIGCARAGQRRQSAVAILVSRQHQDRLFQVGQLSAVSLADASTQVLSVRTRSFTTLQNGDLTRQDVSNPLLGGAATWMDNGDIVFTPLHGSGLERLRRGAREAEPLKGFEAPVRGGTRWLQAIPGSTRFTLVDVNQVAAERSARVAVLGSAATTELAGVESRVAPTDSGYVVFVRDGALVAQRLQDRGFVGDAAALADNVAVLRPTLGHFAATSDVLVYLTREALQADMRMVVVDRVGHPIRTVGETGFFSNLRLSPDGTRVAVAMQDRRLATRDVWIYDLTGQPPLRLTFDPGDDLGPAWSADSKTVAFSSDRHGDREIYRKDAAARENETLVFSSSNSMSLNAWSRDGRSLIYDTGARGSLDAHGRFNSADLFTVLLDQPPRVRPLATTQAHEALADIAPDGTMVAYNSDETGRSEIFVETFPEKRGRWQVTTTGAVDPAWRADGRELFYVTPTNAVASVEVNNVAGAVRFGSPQVLFRRTDIADQARSYAPFPDGQRFVVLTEVSSPQRQQITVRMNWRSALRAE